MTAVTVVIPCGDRKAPHPAAARDLYTGSMFRHTLAAAEVEAAWCAANGIPGRVLILSARHGLLTLEKVIGPYDLRMGQPGTVTPEAVTAQAKALGIRQGCEVFGMLPRRYLAVLGKALRPLRVPVHDVYEGARGIGDQRHINAAVMAAWENRGPAGAPPLPAP
jgi:hypothetical protein